MAFETKVRLTDGGNTLEVGAGGKITVVGATAIADAASGTEIATINSVLALLRSVGMVPAS